MAQYGSYNQRPANQTRDKGRYRGKDEKKRAVLPEITAEDVPEEYVDAADQVMRQLIQPSSGENSRPSFSITTSKLRNILTLVSDIYHVESRRTAETILPESYAKLQMLRIRVVYEAGRDEKNVKPFIQKSRLLSYIKGIGKDRKKMIRFAHYMEALVAYHRFYGGRD